jgi:hypothetical protein
MISKENNKNKISHFNTHIMIVVEELNSLAPSSTTDPVSHASAPLRRAKTLRIIVSGERHNSLSRRPYGVARRSVCGVGTIIGSTPLISILRYLLGSNMTESEKAY